MSSHLKLRFKVVDYLVSKYYNSLANYFSDYGERFDPNLYKKINYIDECHIPRYQFAKAKIPKKSVILDIACGTGYGTKILASQAELIKGVDISNKSIQFARRHYQGIQFIKCDIKSYSEKADYVVSFETIEHISNNVQSTIKMLLRLANKRLIGSIPYNEKLGVNKYHLLSNITEDDLFFMKEYGLLKFYYQYSNGVIKTSKTKKHQPQNIIFILDIKH